MTCCFIVGSLKGLGDQKFLQSLCMMLLVFRRIFINSCDAICALLMFLIVAYYLRDP